jgi:hypothetical protein
MIATELKDGTEVYVTFDIPCSYGNGAVTLNCYFNKNVYGGNPLSEKTPFNVPSTDKLIEASFREIMRWARHIAKGYSRNSKKLKPRCKITTYGERKAQYNSWNFIFSYANSKSILPDFPGDFHTMRH